MRFGRKGKLSPRFIRPYRILKRVGPVAYQLELSLELDLIHDLFHISMLRRYRSDPTYIVLVEEIKFDRNTESLRAWECVGRLGREIRDLERKVRMEAFEMDWDAEWLGWMWFSGVNQGVWGVTL
ncbi:uncharacterized protein [Gossypium hirsutum]|uniref:Tf2-1-like SH3-like domain-containing protein n=1 Tax=Gossypium hirsutum TaxID=3635 RepID=A0A1U8NFW0_GOSHI|nr:uncharacterized protein LOC107947887 [Gossypium hirsutum]